MSEEKGTVFGIDLGTTYSCISYIDETGNPVVAQNMESTNTTPSAVSFQDGEVIVGEVAKDSAVVDPDHSVQFVKTLMGNAKIAKNIDGEDKTPEEISSYILRKVAGDATQTTGFPVENVVITVPAYFGNDERKATEAAGKIAGLNVLSLVQEPVAAAVYYGCTKSDHDQTLLVYDLGGGTFDVTVISVSSNGENIDVICSDGDHNLGGRLWDQAIVEYLSETFREETDYDDDYDEFALQTFQAAAEKAKKALTQKTKERINLNIAGVPATLTIDRETFESLTAHHLDKTITLTQSVIDSAKEKGFTVDKILLVGGSTFMPQVDAALAKNFPDLPREINDPNEAVAKGAALIALSDAIRHNTQAEQEGTSSATLPGETAEAPTITLPGAINTEEVTITNISLATTKSYGVETLVNGESKIYNLIKKNQKMEGGEYAHSESFGTSVANQASIEVKIYENDEEQELIDIGGREPIISATFELTSSNLPAGAPIKVTFSLNSNGVLNVLSKDETTGEEYPLQVETDALSEEEIEQIASTALQLNVE